MQRLTIPAFSAALAILIALVPPTERGRAAGSGSNLEAWTHPGVGPCDTIGVLTLISRDHIFQQWQRDLKKLINGRISTCRSVYEKYITSVPTLASPLPPNPRQLPTPAPRPTMPPGCTNTEGSVIELYARLAGCVAAVKDIPAPAASSTPTPLPFKLADRSSKTIFTIALAADAPTSAQLALKVASELNPMLKGTHDPFTDEAVDYVAVAAPTWTIAQYQQQCASDPATAGAVVVLPPGLQSGSYNALVISRSWTATTVQVWGLTCQPTDVTNKARTSYVTWVSKVDESTGQGRFSFPLATALAVASGLAAFHPVHNLSTANTYSIATPAASPAPGTVIPTQIQTTNGTSTNTSNFIGLTAASAALAPLSSLSIGQASAVDAQTASAATNTIAAILGELNSTCPDQLGPNVAPQCYWIKPLK